MIVIDTNVVLDLLVFNDPDVQTLREQLATGALRWIATRPMRDELERVLAYPQIVKSLVHHQIQPAQVLAQFDAQVQWRDVAPKASVTCKDPDDQRFIDLAVAYRAQLRSKDKAILCMRKRLLALGVVT